MCCLVKTLKWVLKNNFKFIKILNYGFGFKKGASKKEIEKIELKLKDKVGVDVMKYCGLIKLNIDALTIQKTLRDEWK